MTEKNRVFPNNFFDEDDQIPVSFTPGDGRYDAEETSQIPNSDDIPDFDEEAFG